MLETVTKVAPQLFLQLYIQFHEGQCHEARDDPNEYQIKQKSIK